MTTVKIFEVYCYEATMMSETGKGYSLRPWGENTLVCKGEDDGGKDYILPDGYTVCENAQGELLVWDVDGNYCDILVSFNGCSPVVQSPNGSFVLRPLPLAS